MIQPGTTSRFGWDWEAVTAVLEFLHRYQKDESFIGELADLCDDCPDFDWPYPSWELEDVLISSRLLPGEGVETFSDQWAAFWDDIKGLLPELHPWLTKVEEVSKEWGLALAPWGCGVVADMAHGLAVRANMYEIRDGEEIRESLFSDFYYMIFTVPQQQVRTPYPTSPRALPGMSPQLRKAELNRFNREYWEYTNALNQALQGDYRWHAQSVNIDRNLRWFYERVTPPKRTPREIAKREDVSPRAVQDGIAWVSKLIDLPLPKGPPPGRKQLRRMG